MEWVLESVLVHVLCGVDLLEQLGAPRSSRMSVSPHINILCMGLFSGPLLCYHTDLKEQRGFLFPKSQQGTDEEQVPPLPPVLFDRDLQAVRYLLLHLLI